MTDDHDAPRTIADPYKLLESGDELATVAQCATRFGVSKATIRSLVARYPLHGVRFVDCTPRRERLFCIVDVERALPGLLAVRARQRQRAERREAKRQQRVAENRTAKAALQLAPAPSPVVKPPASSARPRRTLRTPTVEVILRRARP